MNGGVNAQTDVPAARVVADADRTGGRAPDSIGAFASDLRELRHGAGNPTLHALARRTLISKSVISEAFAGRRLPTENTVSRLTGALGADPEQWVERRASLSQAGGSALATSGSSPAVARLPAPADRRFRALPRRLIVRVVMIVVLASTPLVSAAWWGHQSRHGRGRLSGAGACRRIPAPARAARRPDANDLRGGRGRRGQRTAPRRRRARDPSALGGVRCRLGRARPSRRTPRRTSDHHRGVPARRSLRRPQQQGDGHGRIGGEHQDAPGELTAGGRVRRRDGRADHRRDVDDRSPALRVTRVPARARAEPEPTRAFVCAFGLSRGIRRSVSGRKIRNPEPRSCFAPPFSDRMG